MPRGNSVGDLNMNPFDEFVDVIDQAGNTVGVVTRRRMREQRLPHRVGCRIEAHAA